MHPRKVEFLASLPLVDGIFLLPKSQPKTWKIIMLWDRQPVSQYCTIKSRQGGLEKENNAAGKDKIELPVPLQQESWRLNIRAKLSHAGK